MSDVGDREHLHGDAWALRDAPGQIDRLDTARAVDDVEPTEGLLRLGEGTVGDECLFARTDGDGLIGERLAEDMDPALAEHGREGHVLADDRASLVRGQCGLGFAVAMDQEQESHGLPSVGIAV